MAIAGLWVYVSATATPLHPNPQEVAITWRARRQENSGPSQWSRARQIVRASVTEQNLPGLSVAVGAGGEIVWAEGFGWANLENKVPVSPETRFRIGTASTALTSAAVGLLLEKDRLKLDEKIQTYVPEFPQTQWPVTLRQVMGHMAGVRSDGGDEGPLFGERCDRPVEALQHLDSELRFEPGTEFGFSNFGWILVSAAVEAAAREPFLLFMQKQIFEPLGMTHTDADSATEPSPERATSVLSEVRGGSPLRPGPDARGRLFLLRGSERFRVHSVRPGALRACDEQRHAAAASDGSDAPDRPAAGVGAGDGLRSWLGPRDRDGRG